MPGRDPIDATLEGLVMAELFYKEKENKPKHTGKRKIIIRDTLVRKKDKKINLKTSTRKGKTKNQRTSTRSLPRNPNSSHF